MHSMHANFESVFSEIAAERSARLNENEFRAENTVSNDQSNRESNFLPNHVVDEQTRLSRLFDGAKNLVDDSYTGRAFKTLMHEPITKHDPHDVKMAELKQLHPQHESVIPPVPADAPVAVVIDGDDKKFIALMVSMDNGSAPGLSVWTGAMLSMMAEDPCCRRYFAHFVGIVNAGWLAQPVKQLLLSDLMCAFSKENGGVRPVTIGELFMRFCAAYAISLISRDSYRDFFLLH